MEEHVGLWWHRTITRLADTSHPEAAVDLQSMQRSIGMLFRAAGGRSDIRIAPTADASHAGPRTWLKRLAGADRRWAQSRLDLETLALPPRLAVFSQPSLNRDLYLWLAALAAVFESTGDWIADNRAATARALQHFSGLRARHAALLQAHLAQRPKVNALRGEAALWEAAVQAALRGDDHSPLCVSAHQVSPVWLWMTVDDALGTQAAPAPDVPGQRAPTSTNPTPQSQRRRRAQYGETPQQRRALLLPSRVESIMTWSERVHMDRGTDDEEDPNATAAADDMDTLAMTRDAQTGSAKVRFDLDLPSAAEDDIPLGEGIKIPEWDWRKGLLLPDHCGVQCMVARQGAPFAPAPALRATARKVRRRLEILRASPRWLYQQVHGDAIDTDAWVRHQAVLRSGSLSSESPPVYAQRVSGERSLATLLLADLSLSTDAYATSDARVIDVIRDALYVFGEALAATGDPFEMLGFSSVRRHHVRLQHLKGFEEAWGQASMARVGAIRPGYYTRMGAALRVATQRLGRRCEKQRLLLVLTDGKPNDLDVYEGRYGLEDTRHAVQQAREAGLVPFCVTIDEEAHTYLPMLFGDKGYTRVTRPQELTRRLTQAWMALAH